ncbi:MAG: efflux RND transporter periplasmic adaptor subunit [Lysobacter sp.]|nr:efflux RND transporter periplasmic adaptor subunit [Lysobacter sp.]
MHRFTSMTMVGGAVLAAFLAGSGISEAPAQDEVVAAQAISKAGDAPNFLVEPAKKGFVCPMHAHVTGEHEGECPICGMDLVPQKSIDVSGGQNMSPAAGHASAEHAPGHAAHPQDADAVGAAVHIAPAVQANLGVRIAQVERSDMHREIETVGKITRVDSTSRSILSAQVTGKLKFVAEKYDGDTVDEGELLFSIASEESFEAQRLYKEAVKAGKDSTELAVLSAPLMNQGVSAEQVEKLHKGAAPNMLIEVRSPKDAYVFIRRGAAGDDVNPGFTVFNIGGNARLIEVTAEIFEQQWGWVEEGQEAEISMRTLPGEVFTGRVVRVDPPVGFTTRTLEVRIEFETLNLKIAQNVFSRVKIKGTVRPDLVMIPSEAVIRTQAGDKVVVVRQDGSFQSIPVVTGEEAKGRTEILSGLSGGESIVASGQFLIDSESSRLADLARFTTAVPEAEVVAHAGHQH